MKKWLSIFLVLLLVFSMMPLNATAASTNGVDRVLTVARNADLSAQVNTPILRIEDRDNSFSGQEETFRLVLSEDAEWIGSSLNINVSAGSTLNNTTLLDARTLQIRAELISGAVLTTELNVQLNDALGEQKVTVDRRDSVLSGDSHTFAIAETGQTVTLTTQDNLYEGDFAEVGSIIIEETVRGTVTGSQTFRLRLPIGFEWNPVHETPANISLEGFMYDESSPQANLTVELSNNNRDMQINFNAFEGNVMPGSIVITPSVRATRDASFGVVEVVLTGQNDISNATGLNIADYKEASYSITSETEDDEFITGVAMGYTATINISESVKDTLIKGRYINIDLPSWVKVVNGTNVKVDINNVAMGGTDTSSFRFLLLANPNWMDGDVFDFDLTFEFVISGVAAINESLDIPVTIEGAGIDETISIGTAVAAITVEVMEATTTYLQAGLQNQVAPEIIVRENFPGALRAGNLMFGAVGAFENSVRFENVDAEVMSGDIVLEDTITQNDNFGVEITADSNTASEIRLYNIEVTMDRTVPDGEFDINVQGSAVLDAANTAHDNLPDRVFHIDPYFMVGVPQETSVAFTTDQATYVVNGEVRQMDVAPYIKNDRMMIPVRYLEDLFGAAPAWDEDEHSVSIEYNGDLYKMIIGSTTLSKNGEPVLELDAEAEITDSRTFVPASRFAIVMGIEYTYDNETRTATFR